MTIQWFPGHMTKALRMMQDNADIVDAIGYVLDARAPASCFNPSFNKIIGNKPCVFILNKCDLADESKLEEWRKYFRSNNLSFVNATATASAEAGKITSAFAEITADYVVSIGQKEYLSPYAALS